jgi:hypothetical protein
MHAANNKQPRLVVRSGQLDSKRMASRRRSGSIGFGTKQMGLGMFPSARAMRAGASGCPETSTILTFGQRPKTVPESSVPF